MPAPGLPRSSNCFACDQLLVGLAAYLLNHIHAASANKTTVKLQRDVSLIPVFLAMHGILSPTSPLCARG